MTLVPFEDSLLYVLLLTLFFVCSILALKVIIALELLLHTNLLPGKLPISRRAHHLLPITVSVFSLFDLAAAVQALVIAVLTLAGGVNGASVENVHLRRCMERLQEYNFKITYIEGKANSIADTLSRYPINPAPETDGKLEENTCICNSIQGSPDVCYAISPRANTIEPCLQELIELANEDEEYKQLVMNLSNHTLFKNILEEDAIIMSDYKDAWTNSQSITQALSSTTMKELWFPKMQGISSSVKSISHTLEYQRVYGDSGVTTGGSITQEV